MSTASKPWWQQATALVTVSASGVITGFNFAPAAAARTTPASVPLHLLALAQAAQPDKAKSAPAGDAQLRAAIVNVAGYYLKLAKTKTPAQAAALTWGEAGGDGTGPSGAAFASLTLELAAQATGLRSWVTGQTTPSAGDAQAHGRWRPLSDGYAPQPGDWAVYDGHVAVVTSYSGGVLDTIAAGSRPGLALSAHSSAVPLADQGITGFVDNGNLQPAKATLAAAATATVPGLPGGAALAGTGGIPGAGPGAGKTGPGESAQGAVPGVLATGQLLGGPAPSPGRDPRPHPAPPANVKPAPAKPSRPSAPAPGPRSQQAFIGLVSPGAAAAQQRLGVPASVTIAQAIEESAWGQSSLAARYHNLFGIKGTGPAGSVTLPTQEYENGGWITVNAQFAVYHNDAESIAGHAELLATSGYYTRAMADRAHPDAFANDLTGVYATDPAYGANLIDLMKLYNLYQYDTGATPAPAAARYQEQLPQAVLTALFAVAKGPLDRSGHLYRDVAATTGGSWQLLAAADWMQCRADRRYSPVQGERLGTVNADGTRYATRTAALAQCAADLIELASAVYGIDLTARRPLSVRELAAAFAAFRWGALLKRHGVSPAEFPYSVAGLTTAHQKMRWPSIDAPGLPDRPGTRFRQPFGAVPVALSLGYPATV